MTFGIDTVGREVAYHGTQSEFSQIVPSERGSFGSGIYWASRETAEVYAGIDSVSRVPPGARVIAGVLEMRKPYHYKANNPDENDYDFDSAAVDLILALFRRPHALALIDRSRRGDGMFGDEIQRELRRKGYDSLVVTYGDGSYEKVVFESTQIVSMSDVTHESFSSTRPGEDLEIRKPSARKMRM